MMPGNSWKDKRPSFGGAADKSDSDSNNQRSSIPPFGSANSGLDEMSGLSPKLDALLEQRRELEGAMRSLSSGGEAEDGFMNRNYPVASLAERRREQVAWEKKHAKGNNNNHRPEASELREKVKAKQDDKPTPEQSLRTGLRDFTAPVSSWLNARDRERQGLRDRARKKLSAPGRVSSPVRKAHGKVRDAADQLDKLDRQLEKEGLHKDREEIKKLQAVRAVKSAEKYLGGVSKVLDAPQRNVKKVDDFWKQKDNSIRGAMDRSGPYVERSRRRLSSETGGSGDLFQRMQRNRVRALAKMREKRQQEARDQQRRERAKQLQKQRKEKS